MKDRIVIITVFLYSFKPKHWCECVEANGGNELISHLSLAVSLVDVAIVILYFAGRPYMRKEYGNLLGTRVINAVSSPSL